MKQKETIQMFNCNHRLITAGFRNSLLTKKASRATMANNFMLCVGLFFLVNGAAFVP